MIARILCIVAALGVLTSCMPLGAAAAPTSAPTETPVPPVATLPLLRERTATPAPPPAPTQTPWVVIETVEVPVTVPPAVVTATPGPIAEPLPTATPWVVTETVEVVTVETVIVAQTVVVVVPETVIVPETVEVEVIRTVLVLVTPTPSPTPTVSPTPTPTPTPTPAPTPTFTPPQVQGPFKGSGAQAVGPFTFWQDRYVGIEVSAVGGDAVEFTLISPRGCVTPLGGGSVPFAGKRAYQISPADVCGDAVVVYTGAVLVVKAGSETAWIVRFTQHPLPDRVIAPYTFDGVGDGYALPILLEERESIALTSVGEGLVELTMLGLYKNRGDTYVAIRWDGNLRASATTFHRGETGVFLPIIRAAPGRPWSVHVGRRE